MMDDDFQGVEDSFSQITDSLEGVLGLSEIREFQEFIDVGEYGLALETLVDIVDEENKKISNEIMAAILGLADKMSMDREVLLEKLQRHTE